ncbi:outer membrane protein OmpA-like peptidoglycan-associated protein [Chitinophaga dinghuensis]|uniref:Outer membrane protein OmpA-like peptidoglycan-associated protein n=1 Tax=Chitinophaga dinghuensis TaxID=1539050 RepID=A0A327W3Y7_9BACT|nr:OmpA family protein [Chitinophaga dinghuensis]RAJ83373.1 outer membrane protein OmpA-like peptidoglycan-associated protein [Chitinophaga dinghuensis]
MIKHITGACLCLITISQTVSAQELGIGLSGGLQGLKYKAGVQNSQLLPGGILDIGYTFPLGKKTGIITGITIGNYVSKMKIRDGQTFSSYQVDDVGSAFRFDVLTHGYTEQQRFLAAGIPVLFQYHTLGKTQWYINGGAKLLFPFSVKYEASADQLILSGYYPDYNIELKDLPQHGFGAVNNWKSKGGQTLKPAVTLSAATGFSFQLNNLRLYTGLYIDYGLNNIRDNASPAALVAYHPTSISNVQGNSLLKTDAVDNARMLGLGIQVRLGIPAVRHQKVQQTAPPPSTPAPIKDTMVMVKEPTPVPAIREQQQLAPTPIKAIPTATDTVIIKRPVLFGKLGQIEIPDGAKEQLDSVAAILVKYQDIKIQIIGHTCDIGSATTNMKVGAARAQAASTYLVNKGVAAERITTTSAGATQPLVPNTSEENRKKNRRVTIILQ